MTVSVASAADFQPLLHAYCAIAEPSSCATLPKLNARRPFEPNRFGPIWSVPIQGAIARTPRSIAALTTGAAKSTSQVVKRTLAFWPSRRRAHALAVAGAFSWVSHVRIWSFRPLTPPFAFTWATRSWAAASAGPSNGAIAPLPSNAQPMMIGAFACVARCPAVAASALPIRTSASSPAVADAHLPRALMYCLLLGSSSLVDYTAPGDTWSSDIRIRAAQTRSNASFPLRASSSAGTSHNESDHLL